MSRSWPYYLLLAGVTLSMIVPARQSHALPEYAVRTGQPCVTCHVSPSGGGLRTPRGQVWVAKEKPDVVPDLVDALEQLGIRQGSDTQIYRKVPAWIPPACPLRIHESPIRQRNLRPTPHEGN